MDPSNISLSIQTGQSSGLITTVLAVVGALSGIGGVFIAGFALRHNQRSHDAQILRDEFSRFRVPLETALQALRKQLDTLRASVRPGVSVSTITGNFGELRSDLRGHVEVLVDSAEAIDRRKLFTRAWLAKLTPLVGSLDRGLGDLLDEENDEKSARRAAISVVATLEGIVALVDGHIENGIHAPLHKRSFRGK